MNILKSVRHQSRLYSFFFFWSLTGFFFQKKLVIQVIKLEWPKTGEIDHVVAFKASILPLPLEKKLYQGVGKDILTSFVSIRKSLFRGTAELQDGGLSTMGKFTNFSS